MNITAKTEAEARRDLTCFKTWGQDEGKFLHRCSGSCCAAWRWTGRETDLEYRLPNGDVLSAYDANRMREIEAVGGEQLGYCGLAGAP